MLKIKVQLKNLCYFKAETGTNNTVLW